MVNTATVLLPALVLVLLLASVYGGSDERRLIELAAASECTTNTFLEENEPMWLRIPAIALESELNVAPVIDGRLDRTKLKHNPAMVSPKASPSLRKIGLAGVSLVLGHRQWGLRPLVFARLDELRQDDHIVVYNEHLSLIYSVRSKIEVSPESVWEIVDKESADSIRCNRSTVFLTTCAPYGHNWHRLVIIADRKAGT